MHLKIGTGAIFLLQVLLSGCATFTPPMERPVIEDKINPQFFERGVIGTLTLTPERRVVLVNFENGRFCGEPPTEVGIDLARLLQATGKADVPDELEATVGVAMAVSSSNSVLNQRSQGVQLFLASSYFACQMYANDAITALELREMQNAALAVTARIVTEEIPYLYKAATVSAAQKGSKSDELRELMELLRSETPPDAEEKKSESDPDTANQRLGAQ